VTGSDEIVARMGRLSKEHGLSPGTIKALLRVRRGGYLSMRDVARGLGCDPSYVTGLVDELAEHGLAERQGHPDDRRIKTVVLTPKGVELADRIEQLFGEPPASFAALSRAEAEQLTRILAKVTGDRSPGDGEGGTVDRAGVAGSPAAH
jgi:DNA-binding MarR family transcriptional regulator